MINCFFLVLVLWSGASFAQTPPTEARKLQSQADAFEDKAAQAIDDGDLDKGIDMMFQAVALDPTPARRMNYGSILYGDGIEIFRNIDRDKGLGLLKLSQQQLKEAIAGFDPNKDKVYLSQCYLILGKISVDAFADQAQAKEYFKRAAELSGYTGAKDELKKIST